MLAAMHDTFACTRVLNIVAHTGNSGSWDYCCLEAVRLLLYTIPLLAHVYSTLLQTQVLRLLGLLCAHLEAGVPCGQKH